MSDVEPITGDEIRTAVADQLGCPATDIADDDDLIQCGLNSIAMMAMAGGWRKRGVHITFAQLAAEPTVAAWQQLLGSPAPAAVEEPAATVGTDDDEPFPLAPMQHAYWIGRADEQQLGGVAAHLYVEFDGGPVDPARLERAVADLVTAHPMLRTRFLPDGTQQTLAGPGRPVFHQLDLRGRPVGEVESQLAQVRDRKTHQRLAIEDGEVIDVTLTRYDPDRSRLHLDIDMLAADAMSYRMLIADLAGLYRGATLPTPGYSYRRYRTERAADSTAHDRDRDYWQHRLAELPGAPQLPTVTATAAPRTARCAHWLTPQAKEALVAGAHTRGITPAMAVAAVFADTIAAWSGDEPFLLNVPLFHREPVHPGVDRVAGDFTSSIMLDIPALQRPVSVADRARDIQRRMYESASHSGYSGLEVLRDLGRLHGEPVLAPIVFTSALDLGELFGETAVATFGEPVWIVSQGPQVLLDAQVTELRGGLLLNWDVRESAFPAGLIDTMFAAFTAAVDRLAFGAAGWDADTAVALPAEQARIRETVNATDGPLPDRCLHHGLFDRAATHPDDPAVLWGIDGAWTYRQLAADALAVAGALRARGVAPGDAVAVQLPKGPDQVLAVLGVLAAGATYVPIGADQPIARREKILATAGVAVVLGTAPGDLSLADARGGAPLAAPVYGDPGDIAYLLFTSGSTGLPKGVEVSHRAAMNTIDALNDRFGVGAADRALGLSALEFDLSVYDVFGMFAAGGAVVALDADQRRAPADWVKLVQRHRVSILNCVPSLLEMLLTEGDGQLGDSLRAVLLGGDWVAVDLARRLHAQLPDCRFAGLGGATEAAIHSTVCEITGEPPPGWTTVPFGRPLRNVRCRVVSAAGRDCPDWVAGELWIGGIGVAAGYRGDPQRTADRFVDHAGLRWYRTGDLARYWPDGTLEFLGRADNQVQIRGYRVELGEVESALRAVPGVRDAVAVVAGDRASRLLAAVTGEPRDTDSVLAQLLPAYMMPSLVRTVDRIALTPNGKIDRRAMTALLGSEPDADGDDTPRTALQAATAAIIAEVLGRETVGVHRDFFALGGDSVLATAVIARLRDWLDAEHAVVADLFATRTAAGLADRLQRRQTGPDRLVEIARAYLEVAALTDEEVLAAEL
ncbi:amino acid adenylation domain-containing protein [Mycobacterium sp. M1]|uniref:Phenyloxazoline synthase MbtB n=1 Tax=Mycolicibacter acidiphilus TaxID=2835306 RepID=A0ABS5RLU4_9MYCO|nr:non-ribosomal peptide synthetase [Mycolicibacter acidiphilus]MBS9534549.1 amino acid adenylation domain-containing protein [Mycolicibacter acidiphilus]